MIGVTLLAAATAGAATITGTAGNDTLRGGKAADRLTGKRGNDKLYGAAGNDVLTGGRGNDLLVGGPGADKLSCGAGRDTAHADGWDVIAAGCEVVKGLPTRQLPLPPPPPPQVGPVTPGSYRGQTQLAAGSLDLQASFVLVTDPAPCPAGVSPATTECRARIGSGFVRGLGIVSVSYFWPLGLGPPTCPTEFAKLLATTGRLIVAGKGEITFTIAEGARCLWFPAGPGPDHNPIFGITGLQPRNEPQEFTITGGTGAFAAASGTGKLEQRWFNWARVPDVGGESWTGTLEVPGLTFDVTPPTLSGATAKTFRVPKNGAKRARVTFKVTATDDVDRAVPVSCVPRSGSRVPVGRWTVRCEATDSSDNTGKTAFRLIVKPRQ